MNDLLWPLLAVFVGVFAVRGLMLGFVHLLVRIVSLITAYVITFNFRSDLFAWVTPQLPLAWPPILVQVLLAMGLFFGTVFVVGRLIHLILKLLARRWPTIREWQENKSYGGRISGMLLNSGLAAFFALIGLWGYGIAQPLKNLPPLTANHPQIQALANKVGGGLFMWSMAKVLNASTPAVAADASDGDDGGYMSFTPDEDDGVDEDKLPTGTALIQSSSNPNKVLYVSERDRLKQNLPRIHDLDGTNAHQFDSQQAHEIRDLPSINLIQSPKMPETPQQAAELAAMHPNAMEQALGVLQNPEQMRDALRGVLPRDQADQMANMVNSYLRDPKNRAAAEKQMRQLMQDPKALQEALNSDTAKRIFNQ